MLSTIAVLSVFRGRVQVVCCLVLLCSYTSKQTLATVLGPLGTLTGSVSNCSGDLGARLLQAWECSLSGVNEQGVGHWPVFRVISALFITTVFLFCWQREQFKVFEGNKPTSSLSYLFYSETCFFFFFPWKLNVEHEMFGIGLSIVIWQKYKSCVVMSAESMTFLLCLDCLLQDRAEACGMYRVISTVLI